MRTTIVPLLAWVAAALILTGCGGTAPKPSGDDVIVEHRALDTPGGSQAYVPTLDGPLRLLSASPAGQLTSHRDRQPISTTFSRPVVPLGEAGRPPQDALKLEPAVAGSLRWEGTQTLVFHPTESLSPATSFTVTLDTTIADRDGNTLSAPYTWTFQTVRPRLVASVPDDGARFVSPDASLRLSFNMAVDAAAATEDLEATFPVASVTNDGDSTLVLRPSVSLEKGTEHAVTLKEGMPSRDYDLGLGESQTVRFRVYPNLALTGLDQPGRYGNERFYPDRGITVNFSTPVRFEDVRKALSFEPSVDLLPGVEVRDANEGTSHTLPATFEPETRYTLTIDGLRDQFGQRLEQARMAFHTRAFEPRLHMDRGMMVIEAGQQPVVPLEVTNVDSVSLGMESLSGDEIVPALPTYDEQTHYERRDQADTRPVVGASRRYALPIDRNTLATVPLRLDSMLTGETGVVGIRLIRPELERYYETDLRAIAQVTHLGVTGKFSPHQNVIVVTELATGAPVSGATVTIRDGHNAVHWRGTTDEAGRVQTPGWKPLGLEKATRYSSPVQYAVVEHEGDVAFTTNRYDRGVEPYRFGIRYSWNPKAETHSGTVFSDRGLYKTAETVHLKGILRTKTDADWHSYRDSVRVLVRSPRDEIVLDRGVTPSAIGTFDLDWSIPDDANLGTYRVRVLPPDDAGAEGNPRSYEGDPITTGTFQVSAFRRATFAVNAQTSLDAYVAGDFFEGRVSGHYLFGAGMAGRPVTTELDRRPGSYSPPGFSGFRFGPIDTDHLYETLSRAETTLDSTSSVAAERTRLSGNPHGAPTELVWRGTVTAPSRQTISDQTVATLHPGRFYVGLKPSTSFMDLSRDSILSVDVVTVDPQGAPVAGKEVTVELVRLQWNSVREVGADGRLRWDSERTETVVRSKTVTTAPNRKSRLHMTVPAGGQYRLRAASRDVRGNAIRSETYLYASGSGYVAWHRDDDDRIDLVPEKTDYAPGETARLMVQSPYEEATALVTVEREGILESRVTSLTGSTPMVEVPITDEYLPNVFVSVILLKGRTAPPKAGSDPGAPSFKIGYASLSVDPDRKHLHVEMTPDRGTYRPGETVTVDVRLADAAGEGVPGEIAFSAADAGVLDLIDYQLPDPFDTFYGPRPLGVTTSELRAEIVEQRSYGQKGQDTGGGGTMEKPEARTDFRPLAHWAPAVQTDESGTATVSFQLPESLTTFRLMATALTGDSEFGAEQTDIVVTKPLVLKDALPRFARMGDEFEAGVLVTNRSDEAGTARITATSRPQSGLTLRNDSVETVRLPAGATREVRFDWAAPRAGAARLTFRARLGGETDAMATTLPVHRPTSKRASATFASTSDTALQALRLPSDRVRGLGQFDVSLASTALVGLDGAVQHLFEYPYGCLEQTTSRVRPLLAGAELLDAFDLTVFEEKNRRQVVREWLGSLRKYWTGDGFALWEGGAHTNAYVTGYTLMALAEAKTAGYDVPQPLTDQTIEMVADLVRRRSDRPEYYSEDVWRDTRAFLLYALVRHGRVLESEISGLATHPPESAAGQSHLLRILHAADLPGLSSARDRLVKQLKRRIRVDAATAFLQAPESDDYGWIFSSDVRATAFGLTALVEATPSDGFQQLAQRMIRYLMDRRQQGHWPSTQDNAAVVTAFQTYADTYERELPDLSASVEMAGKRILEHAFHGRSLKTASAMIDADAFPSGRDLPLAVASSGTGRLYYSMRLTTYTSAPQDALDQGLRVERTLQRLNDRGEAVGAPVRTGKREISLDPGALVKVTLRLSSPTSHPYVVVDDALPAGLEPVNEAFATADQGVIEDADTGSGRWWGSFTHTEMHDDRVLLFADYLQAGEHTYSYVARATTPGTFTHPPAAAEMMYRPETRGHTATGTVTVQPPAGPTAGR